MAEFPGLPLDVHFPADFLEKYEIVRELGHGGMSYVFEARQRNLDRRVAIKILRINEDFEEGDIERLLREGKILATMRHPRILEIYDTGYAGQLPYLCCELVEGESLAAWVEREQTTLRRALEIVVGVADALAFAHQHGTAHRDVKPENILLLPDGDLKLADFGLAHQGAGGKRLTGAGIIIGTPSYMSPEQIQGPSVGPETDQYSLGIVAYELIIGSLPYVGESPLEKAYARLKSDATPLRKLNPAVPEAVEQLVSTALERDMTRRFVSMAHMREAAAKALEKLGSAGDAVLRPVPRSMAKIPRRTMLEPAVASSRSDVTIPLDVSAIRNTGAIKRKTQLTAAADGSSGSVVLPGSADPDASYSGISDQSTMEAPILARASPRARVAFVLGGGALVAGVALAAIALLAPREPVRDPAATVRSLHLVPRPALGPGEVIELARDGESLVARFSTDTPRALTVRQSGKELANEREPAKEHRVVLDPTAAFEASTLTISEASSGAPPLDVELAGLKSEYRRLRHRVEMAPRVDVLHEVLDEWNRAGEKAALAHVERLADQARARCGRLLALAPFLLDRRELPLEDLRWIYDQLSELRVLDRFRTAYMLSPLGAEQALGHTFGAGAAAAPSGDAAWKAARAAGGGLTGVPVYVTTMTVNDATDVLAGDPGGPPPARALTLSGTLARPTHAAVALEGAAPRIVDLVWVKLAGWRLLLTADSADGGRLVHGFDPRLVSGPLAVSVALDVLPGPGQAQALAELPRLDVLLW